MLHVSLIIIYKKRRTLGYTYWAYIEELHELHAMKASTCHGKEWKQASARKSWTGLPRKGCPALGVHM
jgi:hypothetical protein